MSALFDVLPWLVGLVGAALAVLGYGRAKKQEGRSEAEIEAERADHENAEDIRDRVSRDTDKRVREFDDAGWRD